MRDAAAVLRGGGGQAGGGGRGQDTGPARVVGEREQVDGEQVAGEDRAVVGALVVGRGLALGAELQAGEAEAGDELDELAAAAGIDPVAHYCRYGWQEGRFPNPYFDPAWYLQSNSDKNRWLKPLRRF